METLFLILASVIPFLLVVFAFLYILVLKKMSSPHIVVTEHPLKLAGVSVKTCDATIAQDDAKLWKEFKSIREKNKLPASHAIIIVRLHTLKGESLYEYFIGTPGADPNNIPPGFKYLEIPPQRYVTTTYRFQKVVSWLKLATKVKFYIYYKWLPKSKYELNRDQAVKAIEVYPESINPRKRSPKIYVAVKKASQVKE